MSVQSGFGCKFAPKFLRSPERDSVRVAHASSVLASVIHEIPDALQALFLGLTDEIFSIYYCRTMADRKGVKDA